MSVRLPLRGYPLPLCGGPGGQSLWHNSPIVKQGPMA